MSISERATWDEANICADLVQIVYAMRGRNPTDDEFRSFIAVARLRSAARKSLSITLFAASRGAGGENLQAGQPGPVLNKNA